MKKLLTLLLAVLAVMSLTLSARAAPADRAEQAAWTLYGYGLFQGTGTDDRDFPRFDLDQTPNRAQGVAMLVRLLGLEEEALAGTWTTPFTDVPPWAEPYVGLAYDRGLTVGVSATTFAPSAPIRATEYLTLVLRALGYDSATDFVWNRAWVLTDELDITDGEYGPGSKTFDRGDVALVSLRALDVKGKEGKKTLRATLGLPPLSELCVWEETLLACHRGELVFAFQAAEDSPASYSKFVVDKAWVNGQPCEVKQLSTRLEVSKQVKKYDKAIRDEVDEDTFALVRLTYDEKAALAAAEEEVTVGGRAYPVLRIQMEVSASLPGKQAKGEKAEMSYYILDYFGENYNKW